MKKWLVVKSSELFNPVQIKWLDHFTWVFDQWIHSESCDLPLALYKIVISFHLHWPWITFRIVILYQIKWLDHFTWFTGGSSSKSRDPPSDLGVTHPYEIFKISHKGGLISYLSIFILNIFTLTFSQSVTSLFISFIVLCENKYFIQSTQFIY